MTNTLVAEGPSETDVPFPGRTRITSRALSRVVAAVAAGALRVDVGEVNVELSDDRGLLAITVSAPIRVVSLTRIQHDMTLVQRTGGPLLDRTAHTQQTIAERVTALTGSKIGHVTVRLTATRIREERRVQ